MMDIHQKQQLPIKGFRCNQKCAKYSTVVVNLMVYSFFETIDCIKGRALLFEAKLACIVFEIKLKF